jgi:hypothetical protein
MCVAMLTAHIFDRGATVTALLIHLMDCVLVGLFLLVLYSYVEAMLGVGCKL